MKKIVSLLFLSFSIVYFYISGGDVLVPMNTGNAPTGIFSNFFNCTQVFDKVTRENVKLVLEFLLVAALIGGFFKDLIVRLLSTTKRGQKKLSESSMSGTEVAAEEMKWKNTIKVFKLIFYFYAAFTLFLLFGLDATCILPFA